MTVTIEYETPDGIAEIIREDYQVNEDGFVTAYDNPDGQAGVDRKVRLPQHRVVRIDE